MPEALLVGVEAGDEVGVLQADVVQDSAVADDAPVYLIEQDLAPELGQLPRLMAADGLRMRREQAEELLLGGHRLAPEHAPPGLGDRLVDQGQEVRERRDQVLPL